MNFDWDIYKAIGNIFKHRIGFSKGLEIFDDPDRLVLEKQAAQTHEKRFKVIGQIDAFARSISPRIAVVIYSTKLDGSTPRIISVRTASRKERRLYAQNKVLGG